LPADHNLKEQSNKQTEIGQFDRRHRHCLYWRAAESLSFINRVAELFIAESFSRCIKPHSACG
jgi:hypothetical protein